MLFFTLRGHKTQIQSLVKFLKIPHMVNFSISIRNLLRTDYNDEFQTIFGDSLVISLKTIL